MLTSIAYGVCRRRRTPPVRAFPCEHAFRNLALASRSWPGEDATFSAVRAQSSSISSRRTA